MRIFGEYGGILKQTSYVAYKAVGGIEIVVILQIDHVQITIPGYDRFEFRDLFGNRVELTQRI